MPVKEHTWALMHAEDAPLDAVVHEVHGRLKGVLAERLACRSIFHVMSHTAWNSIREKVASAVSGWARGGQGATFRHADEDARVLRLERDNPLTSAADDLLPLLQQIEDDGLDGGEDTPSCPRRRCI
jgi:hypothetical protein